MAPLCFPLDASQTSLETWAANYDHEQACATQSQASLETWATNYDHEQACATQSQAFRFGCHGEENNNDFINFAPVPAPPTQWWYPEDSGTGWDGAYSESQYSPSPPSESTDIV